mmetsp:Transcript_18061/g.39372  ORF Transcript_18061/g.39372 Transcript_18061/m.39372 type:complete len:313 (-) Transcript_18061:381-1319(-)
MEIVLDDCWVLVIDNDASYRGDQINCEVDCTTFLDSRFEMDAGGQFLEDIKSRCSLHNALSIRDQTNFHTLSDEPSGNVWIRVEFFGVQIGVGRHLYLRIISWCQSTCQWLPSTISSIGSAIHFYQAGTCFGDDNFSVTRPIFHTQDIQCFSNVRNDQLGFVGIGFNWYATKIDKCTPVSLPLVVHPYHHGLVNAVETHVVDDVFFSLEKFLAQDLPAVSTIDQLAAHQLMKMFFCLVKIGAQLDSIGSRRFRRFQYDGIGFRPQKFFDFFKFVASGLSNGSHSSVPKKLLLDFFVPTVQKLPVDAEDSVRL